MESFSPLNINDHKDQTAYTALPFADVDLQGEEQPQGGQHTLRSTVSRIAILLVGFFLGLITYMPNIMMGDSGTSHANFVAATGEMASFMMAAGGLVGCILNRWRALVPGIALQLLMFCIAALVMG